MEDKDLAEAWRCLRRLEDVFAAYAGGKRQREALAKVREGCAAAARALGDVVFQDRLRELELYAADLFSGTGHHKWARQEVTGAEWLRFQVYRTFNALDTRLRMLRSIRQASRAARATHET